MGEAISGLIGLIVGGLLTVATQMWNERRQDKKRGYLARKLVAAEMAQAHLTLASLINLPTWPNVSNVDALVPTTAWAQHKPVLATKVDQEIWDGLVKVYSVLESHKVVFGSSGGKAITDHDRRELRKIADVLAMMVASVEPPLDDIPNEVDEDFDPETADPPYDFPGGFNER